MNKFLACQPEAIESTADFEKLITRTGTQTARYILQFPSNWEQLIREQLNELPPVEKKRFNRLLDLCRNNRCVYRVKSPISGANWLESVKTKIKGGAPKIHLALTKDFEELPSITPFSDWMPDVIEEATLPADAENICNSCAVVVETSPELYLFDPYLNPNLPKFQSTISHLLKMACNNKALKKFTIFTTSKAFSKVNPSQEEVESFKQLKSKFGKNFELQFFLVDDSHSDDKLHMRFITGKYGGVRVESGFEARARKGKTQFAPLSNHMIYKVWDRFIQRQDADLIFQEIAK